MSIAASFAYSLTYAAVPSPVGRPQGFTYDNQGGSERIELTGSGTRTVDLTMMPSAGLKGLRFEVDTLDANGVAATAPVTLNWTSNSVPKSEEFSPGGFIVLCSPNPVHGITAMSVTWTAPAVVRVLALG